MLDTGVVAQVIRRCGPTNRLITLMHVRLKSGAELQFQFPFWDADKAVWYVLSH